MADGKGVAPVLSKEDRAVVDKGLDMLDASLKRMSQKASPAVLAGIETDRQFVAAVRQRIAMISAA